MDCIILPIFKPIFHCGLYYRAVYKAEPLIGFAFKIIFISLCSPKNEWFYFPSKENIIALHLVGSMHIFVSLNMDETKILVPST